MKNVTNLIILFFGGLTALGQVKCNSFGIGYEKAIKDINQNNKYYYYTNSALDIYFQYSCSEIGKKHNIKIESLNIPLLSFCKEVSDSVASYNNRIFYSIDSVLGDEIKSQIDFEIDSLYKKLTCNYDLDSIQFVNYRQPYFDVNNKMHICLFKSFIHIINDNLSSYTVVCLGENKKVIKKVQLYIKRNNPSKTNFKNLCFKFQKTNGKFIKGAFYCFPSKYLPLFH